MPGDVVERLEAAVRSSWGYDDLAVYADHLQAVGDPRGELIALDLTAPRDRFGATGQAWRERRRALLAAWVGPALVDEVDDALDLGFIKTVDERVSIALLESPAGDTIRAMSVEDTELRAAAIADKLAALAARPRPWLERLAVTRRRETIVDDALGARLAEATPRLALLEIQGGVAIPHPTVRFLKLTDAAIRAPLPSVVHLDLQLRAGHDALVLSDELLPALASLDLSRQTDAQAALLDALASQPSAAQIETITLPAFEDDLAVAAAERALDAMPNLVRGKVARSYATSEVRGEALARRTPSIVVPAPVPWPAPHTLREYDSLVFKIPEETYDDIVKLTSLVAFLDKHFETFAPAARAAWTTIFEYARPDDARYDDDGEWIPATPRVRPMVSTVARAIDACDALRSSDSHSFAELRAHFRHAALGLSPETPIEIVGYRG